MQQETLEFQQPARRVYTAVKLVLQTKLKLNNVDYDDNLFIIKARHGNFLSPFSENIEIKVVADSTSTSKVTISSSSRSMLNLLRLGANKGNVNNFKDYISNEVYKLCSDEEIHLHRQNDDHSQIKIVPPDIKLKR